MKFTIRQCIMLLGLTLFSVSFAATKDSTTGRLAILSIENVAKAYNSFVASIPTMIVTELVQTTGEQLVERSKIEEAMKELGLESNGVTADGSVRIGQWVGAERILLGSFSELEGTYRLDLRIIEVASGRILAASQATVSHDVSKLVPDAVKNLAPFLAQRFRSAEDGVSIHQIEPRTQYPAKEMGFLKISHQIRLSLFTEKKIPFQRVRVYIDRRLVGISPILKSINDSYVIFEGKIPKGYHVVQLEHGVVDKNGEWKNNFEEQPKEFAVEIEEGRRQSFEYTMLVKSARFEFQDFTIP